MDVCRDPSRGQSNSCVRGASMDHITLCHSVFSLCQGCSQLWLSAVEIKIQLIKLLRNSLTSFSLVLLTLSYCVLYNLYGTKCLFYCSIKTHCTTITKIFTGSTVVCSHKKSPTLQRRMRRDTLNLR